MTIPQVLAETKQSTVTERSFLPKCCNTRIGDGALKSNTTGRENTASGYNALNANTTGDANTAMGANALTANTKGFANTATGFNALLLNTTGHENTAVGLAALVVNTTGSGNTASGWAALALNTTGNNNTAIGYEAGKHQTTGSHNIYMNHKGVEAESGTIRIGTPGTQTQAFLAGISGVAVSGVPVVVDANGQLGVAPSSRRYKEDIRDLGTTSGNLLRLRPVTFRYKADLVAGARSRDYGLIAEDVAQVYPDLVAYGPTGEIETVRYDRLSVLLLNELQKQQRDLLTLRERLAQLEARQRGEAWGTGER